MTISVLIGDCRDVLRSLPSESVHCVVTSPPYWGLRDYKVAPSIWGGDPSCDHEWGKPQRTAHANSVPGPKGRLGKNSAGRNTTKETGPFCLRCRAWRGTFGLEPTYQLYVDHAVEIFAEVRRVLRKDGTLWLNIGDCYATGAGGVGARPGGGKQGDAWAGRPALGDTSQFRDRKVAGIGPMTQPNRMPQLGLKPKDLVGIPWRVAFALQADGWWLRQDIIWSKPNPMPESVTDRCTKAHEYLFLLSKNGGNAILWRHRDTRVWTYREPPPDYVWRNRATHIETREPQEGAEWSRINLWAGSDYYYDQDAILEECSPNTHARLSQDVQAQIGSERVPGKTNGNMKAVARRGGGNRSHKGTDAYEAGASEHRTKAGLVQFSERQRKLAEAGSGIKNNDSFDAAMAIMPVERNRRSVWTVATQPFKEAHFATFPPALIEPCIKAGCPTGGVVLDPFGGAGTTGLVADRLQRDAILIELNPSYAEMAANRIRNEGGMLTSVSVERFLTVQSPSNDMPSIDPNLSSVAHHRMAPPTPCAPDSTGGATPFHAPKLMLASGGAGSIPGPELIGEPYSYSQVAHVDDPKVGAGAQTAGADQIVD